MLSGRVTLTSRNGRVSVAVVNELDQPVTVAVELVAPSDARLSQTRTEVLEVPARTSLPVQVEAQTLTSGRFVVKASLLDREGQPFGEPAELIVTSTRYGSYALAVTGLGVAVLLLAAGGAAGPPRALGRRTAGGRVTSLLRSTRVMALGTVASRATGFLRTAMVALGARRRAASASRSTSPTPRPTSSTSCCSAGSSPASSCRCWCAPRRTTGTRRLRTPSGCSRSPCSRSRAASVLLVLLAPAIVDLYLDDGTDPATRDLAVLFARFFLPQVLFYGAGAVMGAYLNTRGRFGPPMWAPVLNNVVVIAHRPRVPAACRAPPTSPRARSPSAQTTVLGIGVTLGIVAQTVVLVPALRATGFRFVPRLDLRGVGLGAARAAGQVGRCCTSSPTSSRCSSWSTSPPAPAP